MRNSIIFASVLSFQMFTINAIASADFDLIDDLSDVVQPVDVSSTFLDAASPLTIDDMVPGTIPDAAWTMLPVTDASYDQITPTVDESDATSSQNVAEDAAAVATPTGSTDTSTDTLTAWLLGQTDSNVVAFFEDNPLVFEFLNTITSGLIGALFGLIPT